MADKTNPLIAELIESTVDPVVAALISAMPPVDLLRIGSMSEAEHLSGLSEDSWERNHSDKIIPLGPRRKGVRIIDALMLRKSERT